MTVRNRLDTTEVTTDTRYVYAIVYDRMAGSPNRYTAHCINRFGLGSTTVIGRELPLRLARAVVKRHRDRQDRGRPVTR